MVPIVGENWSLDKSLPSCIYKHRINPKTARWLSHQWPADLIFEVHARSRGTYAVRRRHAEPVFGKGVAVSRERVALVIRRTSVRGLLGAPERRKPSKEYLFTSSDLMDRNFIADAPNRLRCNGIIEHPTKVHRIR